ncbi:MAG: hypothetical protein ACRD2Z_09380 [Thermoanaerobaculia bacterium]
MSWSPSLNMSQPRPRALRNIAQRFGRAATWEARVVGQDIRAWPVAAGAALLSVTAIATAASIAYADTAPDDATQLGVGTRILASILPTVPALLMLACWVLPVAAAGWVTCRMIAAGWVRYAKRSERPFLARRWRRIVYGWWHVATAVVVAVVGGIGAGGALLAAVLLVLAIAATSTLRARARTCRWLLIGLATPDSRSAREPGDLGWTVGETSWRRRDLAYAEIWHPADLRAYEDPARARVERAVRWALRHSGDYEIEWPPAARGLIVRRSAEEPLPDKLDDRPWPGELPGVLLGVTSEARATARVQFSPEDYPADAGPVPVLTWDPDAERDLLVAGVKGSGKTTLMRGIIARSLAAGVIKDWYILDGKSGADYAVFEGRRGVRAVGRDPGSWDRILREVIEIMERRYELAYQYESGKLAEPLDMPRFGLLLDELTNIRDELGAAAFDGYMRKLSRMLRAAVGTIVAGTQRPDVREALPGAARDQFEDRIACGWLSRVGAEMMLESDWRYITGDEDGEPVELPRGRAAGRIAGRLCRLQIPWLGSPLKEPKSEALYPPKVITPETAPSPATPAPAAEPVPPATPPAPPAPAEVAQTPAATTPANGDEDQDVTPAAAILAALTDAGPAGATRGQLDTAAGTPPAITRQHLDSLIRDGHVVRQGSGRATRYRLTWHAHAQPAGEPAASQGTTPPREPAAGGDQPGQSARRRRRTH